MIPEFGGISSLEFTYHSGKLLLRHLNMGFLRGNPWQPAVDQRKWRCHPLLYLSFIDKRVNYWPQCRFPVAVCLLHVGWWWHWWWPQGQDSLTGWRDMENSMAIQLINKERWHTHAAAQASFFTRHTIFIIWVLHFTCTAGRVKTVTHFHWADTSIALKIQWWVANF